MFQAYSIELIATVKCLMSV